MRDTQKMLLNVCIGLPVLEFALSLLIMFMMPMGMGVISGFTQLLQEFASPLEILQGTVLIFAAKILKFVGFYIIPLIVRFVYPKRHIERNISVIAICLLVIFLNINIAIGMGGKFSSPVFPVIGCWIILTHGRTQKKRS